MTETGDTHTDFNRFLRSMEWRCIGPFRGGRVVAVAGDPSDPMTFYFGACAGGVWKTTDGGTYWENVSDGFFKTAAVGAIAVSQSDPNVIYAGMGESCIRGDVSHGDGVYRSTDAGTTWAHLGLEETRHIARVRIHPENPDIVYVAALGHVYGPNEQRGVFRSLDGGRNWERVLFRSERAGAADLSMDPNNPRVLYAAIWDARRTPWGLTSGGPDTGLFRSSDGGDSWTELTDNAGMPEGVKGRIGVAASPAQTDRVWAVVQAKEGGLFRSNDGGSTWERVSDDPQLLARSWYYSHVVPDPQDPNTVYMPNEQMWKSTDGGRTLTQFPTPHGDTHDLWIDPQNPQRMIQGDDGGACVSFNGGASWSTLYNQPTAQFYHVVADSQFPYRLYATQQDNHAVSVPSMSPTGAITWNECYDVGGAESGHIAVRQDDPNVVYSGAPPEAGNALLRYDRRTRQQRHISVWPEFYGGVGVEEYKYRFQWTFPIMVSPHDPNVLYVTANVVFRSTDEGSSWEAISPDLTRNDVTKQGPSGGPIGRDSTGVEHYCTIFAFAESPFEQRLLWAGSDDGLVHISRDGGETWENVTPEELPEWSTVSIIEASPHDPATAYLAAIRYRHDDFSPYLYKTNDFGKTWVSIAGDIPETEFTRVVREDPSRRGLLYAGTETGVYVSLDDGESWHSLRLDPSAGSGQALPVVPIHDMVVKEKDLVAATHGRSFWVLDDLTPLHQFADSLIGAPAHLFTPRPTVRVNRGSSGVGSGQWPAPGIRYRMRGAGGAIAAHYEAREATGETILKLLDAGKNPPNGVVVTYWLSERPDGPVSLTFFNGNGETIRRFRSGAPNGQEPTVSTESGSNRFVWDLRYPGSTSVPGDVTTPRNLGGPLAQPGVYGVRLEVEGRSYTASFELLKDPRVSANQEDLERQFALLIDIRDKLSETHDAVNRIRSVTRQLDEWARTAGGREDTGTISGAARLLTEKLTSIEEVLIQVHARAPQDANYMPSGLNAKLAELPSVVASADAAPTRQSYELFEDLSARLDEQLQRLAEMVDTDIAAFNGLVGDSGLRTVVPGA